MTVLMFGWEFPPHIAGGLGTACEGIVKGLAHNGVKSIFVMPSASGDEDQSATTIINASDVAVEYVGGYSKKAGCNELVIFVGAKVGDFIILLNLRPNFVAFFNGQTFIYRTELHIQFHKRI